MWRWVFSVKTFAAAILALYVAFAFGMDRPMWALVTVYVVSQPLSGAIRSKGLYRFAGTLIGAAVAVALTGLLISSPMALTIALVAWICLCGYLASLDRTPRSYLLLLAGLTAVIIALPGVGDPANVFQSAIARSQEIGLGVASVLVVDAIVFPGSVAPVLGAAVDTWLTSAEAWMLDALSDDPERRAASAKDRKMLAADAARLDVLAVHLRYESAPELRSTVGVVAALRERALLLLPTLSAIEDDARELRREGAALPEELRGFGDAFHAWVAAGSPADGVPALHEHLREPEATTDTDATWDRMVAIGLRSALASLVELWSDCRALQRHLTSPNEPLPERLQVAVATTRTAPHRDHGMAIWSALAAALSFAAAAALWAITQWPAGGAAALMAIMMPLFLSGMDDPTPALAGVAKLMVIASIFAGIYMYAVLPSVHSFPTLALALAAAFLPLGFLLADPAKAMAALLPVAQLSFDNGTIGDFTSFANGVVASVAGIVIATVVVALVRAIGADVSAHRLLRAGWAELATIARSPRGADHRVFSARMLDRLGLLVPRLAAVEEGHEIASADALTDLRTGLHLIALEDHRDGLAPAADRAIGGVLAGVAEHYEGLRARRRGLASPPAALLARIDAALAVMLEGATEAAASHARPALVALAGIRRGLFPDAPPFTAPRAPEPLEAAA